MEPTKERKYLELNEETCKIEDGKLIVTVPVDMQSMDGVDFYFNKDFIADKTLMVKSVTISPAPLMCFWNWTLHKAGCPEYYCVLETPIDISMYQIAGIPGAFGFSGYTSNGSDITLTFELAE